MFVTYGVSRSYHLHCNGMVERFNRTLKLMLKKQATTYGAQWDLYLSSVLWAYCSIPHETTGEKPSFLLFGYDCRAPTEAALLRRILWIPLLFLTAESVNLLLCKGTSCAVYLAESTKKCMTASQRHLYSSYVIGTRKISSG